MDRKTKNSRPEQTHLSAYYKQLQKDNEVTQITVVNQSNAMQDVCLWGANSCRPLTQGTERTLTAEHNLILEGGPKKLIYNPANDLFYGVDAFTNAVTVFDQKGQFITRINLGLSPVVSSVVAQPLNVSFSLAQPLVFLNPVGLNLYSIAVQTNAQSEGYGTIAVSSTIAGQVHFINLKHEVIQQQSLSGRPIDIVYNPVDNCFYTAHLLTGRLTKLNTAYQEIPVVVVPNTSALGINTTNGDVYLHTSTDGQISIYSADAQLKERITTKLTGTVAFAYNSAAQIMYVIQPGGNGLLAIDTRSLENTASFTEINSPLALAYSPYDASIYILHNTGRTLSRISEFHQIVDSITLPSAGIYVAISSRTRRIAIHHPEAGAVSLWLLETTASVTANASYEQYREDFQHNPALVSHLKIVASGVARLHTLQLIERSVSGKETCETLSLTRYLSPQNFCNVLEVFDMEGYLLDGHSTWCFKINPKQVVTFLIYHKQIEMYHFVPEKSRQSLGVQMSKGNPLNSNKTYKNQSI